MTLAERMGVSLQQVRGMVSSSEFALWRAKFRHDQLHSFNRTDHYLAQIAAEIVRSGLAKQKDRKKVKTEDYMLSFRMVAEEPKEPADSWANLTPEERAARSKASWLGRFGITPE